jgi:ankyrin repeat protein
MCNISTPSEERTTSHLPPGRMDRRLLQAAQTGNVQHLHQLLIESPHILHSVALASPENPLHVASIAGHVEFAKEILRSKPEFARELNQDGLSPMHMASANGHLEIFRELLKVDGSLCRLEGREKKTPLHYAAAKGRVDVIAEMLLACPECVEDVTVHGETALHLAVKHSQFEAVKALVEWVGEMKKNIVNFKDERGNTILHIAAWKKQRQVSTLNNSLFYRLYVRLGFYTA